MAVAPPAIIAAPVTRLMNERRVRRLFSSDTLKFPYTTRAPTLASESQLIVPSKGTDSTLFRVCNRESGSRLAAVVGRRGAMRCAPWAALLFLIGCAGQAQPEVEPVAPSPHQRPEHHVRRGAR